MGHGLPAGPQMGLPTELRTELPTVRRLFSAAIRADRWPAAPVVDFGKQWSG
jgi:hypothetical protein